MSAHPDVARASQVAPAMSLRSVGFDAVEARLLGERQEGEALQWELEVIEVSWQRSARLVRVVMPFVVHVKSGRKPRYEYRVLLRSTYDVRDGKPPADAELAHFAGVLGVLHAWPYARAELQDLSTKLGMGSLLLPNLVAEQIAETVVVADGPATARKARRTKAQG